MSKRKPCLNSQTTTPLLLSSCYKETCPRTYSQELEGSKNFDDPLISPLLIPDDALAKYPPIYLITTGYSLSDQHILSPNYSKYDN